MWLNSQKIPQKLLKLYKLPPRCSYMKHEILDEHKKDDCTPCRSFTLCSLKMFIAFWRGHLNWEEKNLISYSIHCDKKFLRHFKSFDFRMKEREHLLNRFHVKTHVVTACGRIRGKREKVRAMVRSL